MSLKILQILLAYVFSFSDANFLRGILKLFAVLKQPDRSLKQGSSA